jgi:ubiquitin carboxyl-terminal hydrolase 34
LLRQVHSKEQHAIGLNGFKMIYDDKLPTLKPETISMLGLSLFSQLCQLSKVTRGSSADDATNGNNGKMFQVIHQGPML